MTTDTRPKQAGVRLTLRGRTVTIAGATKGVGMIAPNMATTLGFLTTDATVAPALLKKLLRRAADATYNCLTVDGHTSTNDTLLILASGLAFEDYYLHSRPIVEGSREAALFEAAVTAVCDRLARLIAADAEGGTKVIEVRVTGGKSDKEARAAACAIANSPLVKTAFFGEDPNWGRIVSAAGYAGITSAPETMRLRWATSSSSARAAPSPPTKRASRPSWPPTTSSLTSTSAQARPGAVPDVRLQLRLREDQRRIHDVTLGAPAGSSGRRAGMSLRGARQRRVPCFRAVAKAWVLTCRVMNRRNGHAFATARKHGTRSRRCMYRACSIRLGLFLPALALAAAVGCAKQYTEQADRDCYRIIDGRNDEAFGRHGLFTITPDPQLIAMFEEARKKAGEAGAYNPEPDEAPPPETFTSESLPRPARTVAAGRPPDDGRRHVPRGPGKPRLPGPEGNGLPGGAGPHVPAISLPAAPHVERHRQPQQQQFRRRQPRPRPRAERRVHDRRLPEARHRALVVGNLGLTALKLLNKELGDQVDTTLNFSLDQPLWRGSNPAIVQENLIQAERNALYAVRTFARYEQTFAVSVASQYLGVLSQRDIVVNQWQNYKSLIENRERSEWLAKAERLPQFQVDQARQDELTAYNSWIVAREAYENALDSFKVPLGIPAVTDIALVPEELNRLSAAGVKAPRVDTEAAVAQALRVRLDLMNARDGVDDAHRQIAVAEDNLNGDVDLVASTGYVSPQALGGTAQSARILFNRGNYSVGLKIDMPIDRLQQRNALRTAQINEQAAWRSMTLLEDNVLLQVRQDVRGLEQTHETYANQRQSVDLAEQRVDSTQLLLQAGRATQRDVLDAQSSLVAAQNALTQALVDYTLAGLAHRPRRWHADRRRERPDPRLGLERGQVGAAPCGRPAFDVAVALCVTGGLPTSGL